MAEILTSENFKEKVVEAKGTVLVDFFATWCGPCKMIAPAVEQLAEEYAGKAAVYKVDVDEAQDIGMEYKIMSIPTLVFLRTDKRRNGFAERCPRRSLRRLWNVICSDFESICGTGTMEEKLSYDVIR